MRTRHIAQRIATTCLALVCLLGASCARTRFLPAEDSGSADAVVTNNLLKIWDILRNTMGESDVFPRTLADLYSSNVDTNLFVCPGTGSRAGPMRLVEEWSD